MKIAEWRKGLRDIRVSDEGTNQGEERERGQDMGYVLRVRLASFFAGAAMASTAGLYVVYQDYKVAHHSISDQVGISFHLPFNILWVPFNFHVGLVNIAEDIARPM